MTTKRYDPLLISGKVEMVEFPEGEYVKYEAYEATNNKYLFMLDMNETLTSKFQEGDSMIEESLDSLTADYIERESKKGNVYSIKQARENLLSGAWVYIFDIPSGTPKEVKKKGFNIHMPCPILLDSQGAFPEIKIDGSYRFTIMGRDDVVLLIGKVHGSPSNEWEETNGKGCVWQVFSSPDEGYEYKLMRRKVKTERDEFINTLANELDIDVNDHWLGKIYDAGARLKC